jgi:hypothetical protein
MERAVDGVAPALRGEVDNECLCFGKIGQG